jgi:hypothetical protein
MTATTKRASIFQEFVRTVQIAVTDTTEISKPNDENVLSLVYHKNVIISNI